MNYKCWLSVSLLSAALSVSVTAHADITWNEKHYNPTPLADDVILPMPCGGAMVFRKVFIPSSNPMDDHAIYLGQDNEEWGYIEHTQPTFVAGSFSEKGQKSRYYLMSKYEMTDLQYKALMDGECVSSSNKLRLPAVNSSWIGAMQVADKYNLWLREHAAKVLPKEDGVQGFLRLPTEVEWEFAARGGLEASSVDFRATRYPMPEGINNYEWFAGAQSANGKLQLSGLLQANPLGLHDMLGNASEMMFESFRLNKLNRSHAQVGGYTVRGGNYLSKLEDIRSANRREESYYSETGEKSDKTIGFRLVLTVPILTSRERVASIGDSWNKLGSGSDTDGSQKATSELVAITANVEDEALKEKLKLIEGQLRASNQQQEEARNQAIRASLNLGAFLCTKMLDDGNFIDYLEKNYAALCVGDNPMEGCSARKDGLDVQKQRLSKLSDYYASSLIDSASLYGTAAIEKQVPVMNELLERNKKMTNLKPYLAAHWENQQIYLNKNNVVPSQWLNNCKAVR